MNWTEVKIYTNTIGIDVLTGVIMDLGIQGFAVSDASDFNEFLEGTELYWDYVDESLMELKTAETCVTVYLPENLQGAETLQSLKNEVAKLDKNLYGRLEIELNGIREEDWENNWKQYFKPFKVGSKFVIKPSWENYDEKTDRMILEIDPASSFGTGTHNTTQLCISALENVVTDGCRLLDMGTGSGILSIAASMLGASDIVAVDIDENSVKIAKENCDKNNIEIKTFCGNVIADKALDDMIGEGYNIIVANIVADVIIAMADIFKRKLAKDATLICSGIIDTRKEDVMKMLSDTGFSIIEENISGDWVCIVCKFS